MLGLRIQRCGLHVRDPGKLNMVSITGADRSQYDGRNRVTNLWVPTAGKAKKTGGNGTSVAIERSAHR